MAINDKLNRIKEIKEDIKQALIDKGVEVTDEDSFASYADKITNIPQEGGGDPYYEDLYNLRTSNGTNMSGLFARMSGDNLDLTGLDVSKCTDMSYMFEQNKCNNIDCSGWDVSNVNKVDYMFSYCSANINTTGWDTSKWTTLYYLFNNFSGSIDISDWDLSNVNNVQYMFSNAKLMNIKGISTLKLPKVDSLAYIFYQANGELPDLSNWDVSKVTNMQNMFAFSSLKKIDLSGWNTSNATNMSSTFYYLTSLTDLIIPEWDMTNVTSSSSFLYNASKLEYIDLSKSNDLTISKITSFMPTKTLATYGEIHIPEDSSQEVINALIAKYWKPIGPKLDPTSFEIASELDEVLLNGKTKIHIGNITPWYTSANNVEFISSDESIATVNEDGEVTPVSTGNVEIYARLKDNHDVVSNNINIAISESDSYPNVIKFRGTSTPTSNNYVKINGTSVKLTAMSYNSINNIYTYDAKAPITSIQFNGQGSSTYSNTLTELIKLNITSITDMQYMFRNTDITSLDAASNWDTSNVNAFGGLFNGCSKLETLDLSKWDTRKSSNNTGLGSMFRNVPPTCQIYIDKRIWESTMTESATGFNGTFIDITPEWHTDYYTEYTIDTSVATFSPIDTIQDGPYLPQLSNGYTHIELTLNDGSTTTDLNTEALLVSSIRIYYPEETSYIKFANTKVKDVTHLNGTNITDCTGMFTNCVYLQSADLSTLDSTKVTVDTTMFEGVNANCTITVNENWDITEDEMGWNGYYTPYFVEYTIYAEEGTTDTLKTTLGEGSSTPKYLPKIYYASSIYDLKVSDINEYITVTLKNGSTTKSLDTLVTDVESIRIYYPEAEKVCRITFAGSTSSSHALKNISYIKMDEFINMQSMFFCCKNLTTLDVTNWNTSKVTDMQATFQYCENLTTITGLGTWDVSNVTNLTYMFYGCRMLSDLLGIKDWDTGNVTKMQGVFNYCGGNTENGLKLDISNWDTSSVTDMSNMFYRCKLQNSLDLSRWDTRSFTSEYSIAAMFKYCEVPSLNLSNFLKSDKITRFNSGNGCMFEGITAEEINVSSWDVSSVTDMNCAFSEMNVKNIVGLDTWDVSNVTNMKEMFYNSTIETLSIPNWDTGNVTDMYHMFYHCRSLTSLDISNWDVSSVTNMQGMFMQTVLTTVDIKNWDVSSVTNMQGMFGGYSFVEDKPLFENLDLSGWNTKSLTNIYGAFGECLNLKTLNLTGWSTENITDLRDAFANVPSTCAVSVSATTWTLTEEETGFTGTFIRE